MRTGAELLWECLRREGVDTVFGYPGGAILPAYDALLASTIRHVLVRHEQGAAHMADGYARASGRPGVVMATSGPGATNLVTGLATAMMDSVPMVAITGQVPSALLGSDAFQEIDITGVTLPITKHSYLVTRAEDVVPAAREALAVATSGRPGPVLLDITKDAQLGMAEMDWDGSRPHRHLRHLPPAPTPQDLDVLLDWINASRRPIILAGHGVTLSGAADALLRFAERASIPVASTLLGLGAFPASHPLSLGFMGMHGAPWVNLAIQESDLVLAFGMRFDDRVTGDPETFAPRARKVHVDIDASELGKIIPVDLGLHGDLKSILDRILPGLPGTDREDWFHRLDEFRGEHQAEAWPWDIERKGLGPLQVLSELNRQAADAIVVTDVGQHQMWQAQAWKHELPRTLITSGGCGTMGYALPAGLGAKLAKPESEVWVVAGDGGIQMNIQELATLNQEAVKLNIVVINNGLLGMVRQLQTMFYGDRRTEVAIRNPDFLKLAEAFGIPARRIFSTEEARKAIEWARQEAGPCFLEFVVDGEATVFPTVPPGKGLEEMIHRPAAAS